MKYLVNHLHERGLGVIVDWIPAHYARDEGLTLHKFDGTNLFGDQISPWKSYYVDFGLPEVKRLFKSSAIWWLKEFHIDALRIDAVSQIVRRNNLDIPEGIEFLQDLNNKIHKDFPGVLSIAEATDWDPRVTQPTSKGGFGFDLNWSVGATWNLRNYLRTPLDERQNHHRDKLEGVLASRSRVSEKIISTHSHDDTDELRRQPEEPLFKLGKYVHARNKAGRFADIRNFSFYKFLGRTGGHLFHMGDELAQAESWFERFNRGLSGVQWDLEADPSHASMRKFLKAAICYYKSKPDFWQKGGANYRLLYSWPENKIIAYRRDQHIIIHNFSDVAYSSYIIHVDQPNLTAIERLNSDESQYGGSGQFLNPLLVAKGNNLTLSLPALSGIILEVTS